MRAAIEIQDALNTRNLSLTEGRRLVFRIGINLGDFIQRGDDLLGDGVNIAARLESNAAPGGICISGSVYDQIQGAAGKFASGREMIVEITRQR